MISLVKFTLLFGEFISRKTKVSAHTCYKHNSHLLIELINFLLKLHFAASDFFTEHLKYCNHRITKLLTLEKTSKDH